MSELPTSWIEVPVADLGHEVRGSVVPGHGPYELYSVPAFPTGRPEILDGSEIGSAKRPVQPGDVLLCRINPRINRVWMVQEPLGPEREQIASTEYLVFRTGHPGLSRYLVWYLQSPVFRDWIKLSAEGATGSHTRAKSGPILRQRVPLPPLNEQRRIVAAIEEQLSRLDAAEASLAAASRRLVGLEAAMLQEFVNGGAVELGTVVSRLRYGTSVKCLADADGPPVIRIPNIRHGRIDQRDLKFATVAEAELGDCFVQEHDMLFVRTNGSRNLIGRVGVVGKGDLGAFASYLIRARPDPSRLDARYAALALSTPQSRARIVGRAATTAGQYNLNLASLRTLPIPLPPLEEQRRIAADVEERLAVVEGLRTAIERSGRRSASLRRAVLKRAFRGELVPQDPTDEPASVLLERIASERAKAEEATGRRPRRRATIQTS